MKVGDLVQGPNNIGIEDWVLHVGIVIEVINSDYRVPPVCKVMWQTGLIEKEWTDDIEVINESR